MRHFLSRNLVTLSVAIAGLIVLVLGTFLTWQSLGAREATQRSQHVNQVVDTLLRMSEYQARERGLTAAYLEGAGEVEGERIETLRARVDHYWQSAQRQMEQTPAGDDLEPLFRFHEDRVQQAWESFSDARDRVDQGEGAISAREWFDTANHSIASATRLRERLLLITGMPSEIARLNQAHKHALWLISEHTGQIRGLLAFHAAGDVPMTAETRQQIRRARREVRDTLAELAWLKETALATPRLTTALESLQTHVRERFIELTDTMLAGAENGDYPLSALAWFEQATLTVDKSLQVAGMISTISEQRLSQIAARELFLIKGILGAFLLSGVLALFSLRRVRRNADALFHQKELAETALHSIGDAVITTDQWGYIDYMNPLAEELTGWILSEAKGRASHEILRLHSTQLERAVNPIRECLQKGWVVSLTSGHRLIRRDGREMEVEDSAAPIRARDASVVGAILVFYDTDSSDNESHLLAYHATRDSLTGLINRREFDRRLVELLGRARDKGEHHVLAYIDLDQFKVVNDTCGHEAGDRMLRQVTFLLRKSVRDSDTLARLGGDEFALLLQNTTIEQALPRLEELRRAIRGFAFSAEGKTFNTSLSVGAVPIEPSSATASKLLSEADAACYAAKEKGRNRIQVFQPDDLELSHRKGEMHWVSGITDALHDDRFELFCQPLASLRSGMARHREILLRMRDREGGLIPPMAFMPAAERYNLSADIDRWVIARTCRELARAPASDRDVVYQINLSGLSLSDSELPGFIRDRAREYDIAPRQLCFEVTETAAVASLDAASELMRELHRDGFSFALDDFGSGLSSFTYLKALPVQQIKVDGIFVRDMLEEPLNEAMIRAVVDIGHVLNIAVCAEFVESTDVLHHLQGMGIDLVQGFAIARPQPLSTVQGKSAA